MDTGGGSAARRLGDQQDRPRRLAAAVADSREISRQQLPIRANQRETAVPSCCRPGSIVEAQPVPLGQRGGLPRPGRRHGQHSCDHVVQFLHLLGDLLGTPPSPPQQHVAELVIRKIEKVHSQAPAPMGGPLRPCGGDFILVTCVEPLDEHRAVEQQIHHVLPSR